MKAVDTYEDALALINSEMITMQEFIKICSIKNWPIIQEAEYDNFEIIKDYRLHADNED